MMRALLPHEQSSGLEAPPLISPGRSLAIRLRVARRLPAGSLTLFAPASPGRVLVTANYAVRH